MPVSPAVMELFDFDGTLFDTFSDSPSGVNIDVAYRRGVRDIFGSEMLMDKIGGLKNRTPIEVVTAILSYAPGLIRPALGYAREHAHEIRPFLPRGYRASASSPLPMLAEALVQAKLHYLVPEIGPSWPRPFPGAIAYLEMLAVRGIPFGIISSGHRSFITKTFEVLKGPQPLAIISDDDMRPLGLPIETATKPSTLLVTMILSKLWGDHGLDPRIIKYMGDCPIKDRGLANNAGIRFAWFNPSKQASPPDFGANEFEFYNWNDLVPGY